MMIHWTTCAMNLTPYLKNEVIMKILVFCDCNLHTDEEILISCTYHVQKDTLQVGTNKGVIFIKLCNSSKNV